MSGMIQTQKEGAIGWLIFAHPERRNAISVEMWNAIPGAVHELAGDDAVRVVVMRGEQEEAFISGADISEFEQRRTGENVKDYDTGIARAFLALVALQKPLIAMIHGFCIGGGVAIALTADIRYASDDASFAIPAARLGVGYQMEGVQDLARLVGLSHAKEILFTARRFSAEEALRMGLVNAVYPAAELQEQVRKTAERMAENAPLTLRSIKLIGNELARPPDKRDIEAINRSIAACVESEDYQEGIRAFLEKRRPDFKGR